MPLDLFPQVPEDLEAVEIDALRGFLDEFTTIGASLRADLARPVEDREVIPADATADDITAAIKLAITEKKRVEVAVAGREEAEQNFVSAVDEGLAELGVAQPEALAVEGEPAESEPEPGEPEPEPEPTEPGEPEATAAVDEALAAEGEVAEPVTEEPPARRPMAIPKGAGHLQPTAASRGSHAPQLQAVPGLRSVHVVEGQPFTRSEYAETAVALAKRLGTPSHVQGGGRERYPIGKVDYTFPEEFTLNARDQAGNLEKMKAVAPWILGEPTELEVFQASGGICAPPTPFYDVPGFASRDRPVRGALPSYNAARGGISVPSVSTIDRDDTGVTIITVSQDEGGTFTKACRSIDCATWTDTFIGIVSHCLEVGVLNQRTWPEGVALENDNLLASHASQAERRLLDQIKALSVNVTSAHIYNAVHDFIYAIARTKAAIRYHLRAPLDAQFTALIPEFVREELVVDLAGQSHTADRYVGVNAVEQYLARLGITVVWVKDPPTGVTWFATESAGTDIDKFPSTIQWGLYLNGTFLHLDGGSLELGLIRDSGLVATNDYELFGELFEAVARLGPALSAYWITSTVTPTGQFPPLTSAALS